MQEHRAWAHLGATPRDLSHDLADARRPIDLLEQKHGGADPTRWRWGEGMPCADVFAADEAKRKRDQMEEDDNGMDLSNIITGKRRRADVTYAPAPAPLEENNSVDDDEESEFV